MNNALSYIKHIETNLSEHKLDKEEYMVLPLMNCCQNLHIHPASLPHQNGHIMIFSLHQIVPI